MTRILSAFVCIFVLIPSLVFADATPIKSETEKAIKDYKESVSKVPAQRAKDASKSNTKLDRKYDASITKKNVNKPEKIVYKKSAKTEAEELFVAGKYAEAIRTLIPEIRLEPNNHELRYLLASCYIEYGMPNKASDELNNVLKLKPDFAPAHVKLGIIYKRKGNADLALREFAQASELMPNNLDLKYQLGKIYLEKGLKDKALEEFKTILIFDPGYYPANLSISDILVENKDYENAIEELRLAAIYSPKNPEIHYKLGKIYMLQGNKNSAIEEYRILKDMNPEYAKNLFMSIFPEGK